MALRASVIIGIHSPINTQPHSVSQRRRVGQLSSKEYLTFLGQVQPTEVRDQLLPGAEIIVQLSETSLAR
jgi:hypothetical protein